MPKINSILKHITHTFRRGSPISSANLLAAKPWLKHTIQDNTRKATNLLERKVLRNTMNKNPITALTDSRYRQRLGKQIRGYGKSLTEEITHPVKSMKKQVGDVLYSPNPASLLEPGGMRYRSKSHLGKAISGGLLFGLPVGFGISSLKDKDPDKSKSEKAIRSMPEFLSMLTPKGLPSMAMYQLPSIIYKKKDKARKLKKMQDALNLPPPKQPERNFSIPNLPINPSHKMDVVMQAAELAAGKL